jgi:hypothetical protein
MSVYFQNFPILDYDMYDDGHTMKLTDIFRTVRIKSSIKEDILLYHKYTIKDGQRPDQLSLKLYGSPDYFWTFFMVNENLVNYYTDWPLSRQEFEDMIVQKYDGYVLTTNQDISQGFVKGEIVRGLISGAYGTLESKDANTNTFRVTNIVGQFRENEIIRGDISNDVKTITGQTEYYNATKYYVDGDGAIVDKSAIVAIPVTYLEYEKDLNDLKAEIRVIRPAYITRIADEFFKQINPNRE